MVRGIRTDGHARVAVCGGFAAICAVEGLIVVRHVVCDVLYSKRREITNHCITIQFLKGLPV